MRKRILSALMVLALSLVLNAKAYATSVIPVEGDPFQEPVLIRCTCYTDTGITSSGHPTRHGVIAGMAEWEGCVALLYTCDTNSKGELAPMELIGIYEVLDTGRGIELDDGTYSLPTGQSIDVWVEDMDEANAWVSEYGDYVYMMLVRGVG